MWQSSLGIIYADCLAVLLPRLKALRRDVLGRKDFLGRMPNHPFRAGARHLPIFFVTARARPVV
jgi:hypothetical protein